MAIKNKLEKVNYYFRRYGFMQTMKKIFKRLFHIKENRKSNIEAYKIWMSKHEPTEEEYKEQVNTEFNYFPKISIVVPVYNTELRYFKGLIDSVIDQTYSNWELCLADGSDKENLSFKNVVVLDNRIKYKFLKKNMGIADNTNQAIKMAKGEYIAFLDHDDLLSKDCLFEVVKRINDTRAEVIYTDEDKIDENHERFEPYFKPDYSPETLECNNYITHLFVIKATLLKQIGLLDKKFNGAQDFDLVLRACEKANKVEHIAKILYHWRVSESSTAYVADTKPYAYEAGLKVIESHMKRTGKKAKVTIGQDVPGIYNVKYDIKGNPKVSIIIPNKDSIELIEQCVKSIIEKTTYNNYEIVIVENNSETKEIHDYYDQITNNPKVKIIKYPGRGFNYSSIINYAVKSVNGDFILQLNNDTKIISHDWLEYMVGYAQNKEIGAVGGRLYYEDKSIQHAGIIVGLSGIAGNMLVNLPYGEHAYFGREAATRNVAAITGACMLCRRELYEEVGYMDENDFGVAFNDVDFCLKLLERGYRNVYIPYVELYHYESKTRGYEYSKEKEARFDKECEKFKNRWKEFLEKGDPYYNPNFSLDTCNYDIKID